MDFYPLMIGAGASLGLWAVARHARERDSYRWASTGVVVLLGCLAGARIFFVQLHVNAFAGRPQDLLAFWQGGLAWPGAVLGGFIALALAASTSKTSFDEASAHLFPLILPLAIASWLGCLSSGCAYGPRITADAWWGLPGLDESGLPILRLPLQPLAALTLLAFGAWLESVPEKRLAAPKRAALVSTVLAVNLLLGSLMRADVAFPAWLGLRVDVWAAGLFTLASLLWYTSLRNPIKVPSGVS